MNCFWAALGWIAVVLFAILLVSMLLLGNWLAAGTLFMLILLCLPPISRFFKRRLHPFLRGALILGLFLVFVRVLLPGHVDSIYHSSQIRAQFLEIYDRKMQDWPVPYEDAYLDTRYGTVHVIVSGRDPAPPLLLLHAAGVGAWSWKHNITELSRHFRCYAIDLIGDAGKSEYADLDNVMKTGRDQAELYAEITQQLGVAQAHIMGASEGGFIATNYALHYPERVLRLALLGPMGYTGALQAVIRITFAQLFPLKHIQDQTFAWAFLRNEKLQEEFGEWFPLLMSGCQPVKVMPLPFSPEERRHLRAPVLFVFGERDNLVGDPQKAAALVQDISDVRVEIVPAGHLMAAEDPEHINALVMDFFGEAGL